MHSSAPDRLAASRGFIEIERHISLGELAERERGFERADRSANKQFIAPLPIPPATAKLKSDVSARAKSLQETCTKRRNLVLEIEKRLATVRMRSRPETWLFPTLKNVRHLLEKAPQALSEEERTRWAEQEYEQALAVQYKYHHSPACAWR